MSFRTSLLIVLSALLAGGILPLPASAQTPPGTDIWVFAMNPGSGAVDVGSGARATSRAGYDNQPHFLPGGGTLLFTSIDEEGNADIATYDLDSGVLGTLVATSPESEYSATLMPSGEGISVIRVEADSRQRLWGFDSSGQTPRILLPDIEPVGYHAWIDEDRLALFVLGDPATLQVASLSTGIGEILATDIGRSIFKIPGQDRVSYVQWGVGGEGLIMALDADSGESEEIAQLLSGNEFYCWTPSGSLVMGQDSRLFVRTPGDSEGWTELADLSRAGVRGISRIAINPEGDRIAVVGVGG